MDEAVNRARTLAPCLLCGLLAAAMLASPLRLGAQTLLDPTQPPAAARLQAGSAADVPVVPPGPQLQSILIGSRGREVAVIDGQTVRRGEKINGAVLVQIGKNQVVLQKGAEKQVLTLFPDQKPDAGVTGKVVRRD